MGEPGRQRLWLLRAGRPAGRAVAGPAVRPAPARHRCARWLRYLVGAAVDAGFAQQRPWGTVTANPLGSGAAGLLTGFPGACTTASTYAVAVLDLAGSGRRRDALLVVSLSVVLGLALAFGAFQVGRAL